MWKEHVLPTVDLQLAWYETGNGPVVVFLHGGPGDDHSYLRPLAEPLSSQFRCILYDQRGSGHSYLRELREETLHINRFFEDLEALRLHLAQPRLRLIGHSWGATLALLYGMRFPDRIERMALIGLGPLNDELAAVASANLLQPLSRSEREEFERLSTERRLTRESGNLQKHRQLHIQLVTEYYIRSRFYSPEAAERFRIQYRAMYSNNPFVATYLLPSVRSLQDQMWQLLPQITAPLLILYGYQDFEPITQACLLTASMPQAQVSFFNECGHVPWLEQLEQCTQSLETFLSL